jgi:hypothetical protein
MYVAPDIGGKLMRKKRCEKVLETDEKMFLRAREPFRRLRVFPAIQGVRLIFK